MQLAVVRDSASNAFEAACTDVPSVVEHAPARTSGGATCPDRSDATVCTQASKTATGRPSTPVALVTPSIARAPWGCRDEGEESESSPPSHRAEKAKDNQEGIRAKRTAL